MTLRITPNAPTAVCMLLNLYLQTYTFALKYTGENIASVMYANDGKAVSMGGGLLSIGFTAIAFVVGVMLFRKSKSKKVKFGYVAGVLIVMAIITIRNNVASANNVQGAGTGLSHMAFGMGMMTLFLSLGEDRVRSLTVKFSLASSSLSAFAILEKSPAFRLEMVLESAVPLLVPMARLEIPCPLPSKEERV